MRWALGIVVVAAASVLFVAGWTEDKETIFAKYQFDVMDTLKSLEVKSVLLATPN